jgi:hypothetical protein
LSEERQAQLDDFLLPYSRYLPQSVEHQLRRRVHERAPSPHIAFLKRLRQEVFPPGRTLRTCDELGCLFIHVPKCAGMSVAKSLFGNMGPCHITAAEYQLLYTPSEIASLFKFTFVRNPWDRLASAFFFLKGGGMNEYDAAFAAEHLTPYADFEHFVMEWINDRNIRLYDHFRPQMHFLAVNGRTMHLDFMGRFEQLADDFAEVSLRLGRKIQLTWTNRTRDRVADYASLYTPKMIDRVAAVYAQDVRALRYSFQEASPARRLAA